MDKNGWARSVCSELKNFIATPYTLSAVSAEELLAQGCVMLTPNRYFD